MKPPEILEENKQLSRMNTWKLEGASKYYAAPRSIEDLQEITRFASSSQLPIITIGNGSNLYIDRPYFNGIVVHLNKYMKSIEVDEEKNNVFVYSGMALPALATKMANAGIEGFDFFAGIPGTVGGAVAMNAGCLGKDTRGILLSVLYMNELGEITEKPVDELNMHFRTSCFLHTSSIIIGGRFHYQKAENFAQVKALTKKAMEIRKDKFPKGVATVGSTFKSHPDGPFPGKLVDEVNLKGYDYKSVKISEKHGNWVINKGGATAGEIEHLMHLMYIRVLTNSNIEMEPEVIFLSDYLHGKNKTWEKILSNNR